MSPENPKPLKISLLEPFFGGSHRRWAEGYRAVSDHEVDIISLPPRHWKWRMHGAAVTFARRLIESGQTYDVILANDMMDIAVFAALVRQSHAGIPIYAYFHENQIGYPVSPKDTDLREARDRHYGFINYTSALAADRVFFNSAYHRQSFLDSLPAFLGTFPDARNAESIERIAGKASVLPLGLDLRAFDACRSGMVSDKPNGPLLLWNHRWEYDKRPEAFLKLILALLDRKVDFELALLGERGREEPALLGEVRDRLGGRLVQDGPVDQLSDYAQWLWRADILPVTSNQDFFGASVVEAIYCGCHPILPSHLAYGEHLDGNHKVFYASEGERLQMLLALICSGRWQQPFPGSAQVRRYDWSVCSIAYDQAFTLA